MDKDALVKIKRTTAGFKGEIKHDDWSVNLRSFKEIREAFCATCQQSLLDGKYIDELHKIKIDIDKLQKEFSSIPITTDRLQTENIFLNPDIWHILVESNKERLFKNFQLVKDKKNDVVFFSELLSIVENPSALILRISTFKNNPEGKDAEIISTNLDNLILRNDITSLNDITNISKKYNDFSIHEYYLPYGLNGLKNAILLYRYDTSDVEHINYYCKEIYPKREIDLFNQQYIPTIYKIVYPDKLAQPHFHFSEGVASIYKLASNPKYSKPGDGYGIGIEQLLEYLIKIKTNNYDSSIEENLYQDNDFGMPFRHFPDDQFNKVLTNISHLNDNPHDFLVAYKTFDSIDKINDKTNDNTIGKEK